MNFVVQSRFACLNNDDDDEVVTKKNQKASKENVNTVKNKKDKKNNVASNKQQNNNGKKQKPSKGQKTQQWEEWKQKDESIVAGNFEQDLENAITLSKLDFEKNKDKYVANELGKEKKSEKKKNAKKTISLDEFLLGDTKANSDTNGLNIEKELCKEDFFNKVSAEAKCALNKEKLYDQFLERQNSVDDALTISQYEEKLSNEQKKNKVLESELDKSKQEIKAVKERNKTLYTLLSTGEMKGKAEIINELEKLTVIKDELTQEVTRLHGLLEQERSKVATLMNEKQHKKGGKKHM